MPGSHILQLFNDLEPTLKTVVLEVLNFEQQNISYARVPRAAEQIDEIINRAARQMVNEADDTRDREG